MAAKTRAANALSLPTYFCPRIIGRYLEQKRLLPNAQSCPSPQTKFEGDMRVKSRIDPDWNETDPNYLVKREHGAVLIERQMKLLDAGFRVDIPRTSGSGAIFLQHPNKTVPKLAIWDDGLVNDAYPSHFKGRDDQRTIFEPEDGDGFDRFVAGVPKPNFIERIRHSTVENAFYVILAWSFVIAFVFVASDIGEKIRGWIWQP